MKKPPALSEHFHPKFIGTTVMGERGQTVIPKEAREALCLASGSKLIVMVHPKGGIILIPAEHMREALNAMTKQFADIKRVLAE